MAKATMPSRWSKASSAARAPRPTRPRMRMSITWYCGYFWQNSSGNLGFSSIFLAINRPTSSRQFASFWMHSWILTSSALGANPLDGAMASIAEAMLNLPACLS